MLPDLIRHSQIGFLDHSAMWSKDLETGQLVGAYIFNVHSHPQEQSIAVRSDVDGGAHFVAEAAGLENRDIVTLLAKG